MLAVENEMNLITRFLVKVLIVGIILNIGWAEVENSFVYPEITSSQGKIMIIKLNFASDNISLLEFEVTSGYYNDFLPRHYPLVAKIFSFDGKLLGKYEFADPRAVQFEQGSQRARWHDRDNVNFTLVLPFFSETQMVKIYSDNKLMLSIDISKYYTIVKGKITDHNGLAVAKAYISIGGNDEGSTVTDAEGSYELLFKPGNYTITIEPPLELNLMRVWKSVTISPSKPIFINFTLTPCGSIAGKITDIDGNPLTEAWVQMVGIGTARYHVKEEGNYIIPYLKPGEYKIKADAKIGEDEVESLPKKVKVELGKTSFVDFVVGK